jgi:mono/diheme cytochrome c family protein
MNPRNYVWLASGTALLAAAAVVISLQLFSQSPGIDPDDPVQVASGRQIYVQHCAMCHGANLEGQPNWMERKPNGRLPAPPHDVSGHTWHHPDRQLVVITKKGMSAVVPGYESDMPAFENVLTDEAIAAVLAFIESQWPPDTREHQRALTRAAP